ncbi:MAG: ABC transporter ATP-binding protein [Verrucomicrobia bacterium]|nr:MAG: ABC transporter ATP-binding protein [Verrucomicrobiota bacterium]
MLENHTPLAPAPPPPPAIVVRDLVKTYAGQPAVRGVSFEIAQGEIIGLLGPNGAGKSTTLRILTGYLPATSGEVIVCGVNVAATPNEVKTHLGYMPENNPLPDEMRVGEYLFLRGRLKGLRRRQIRPRIDEVLHLCDLGRVRDRIIGKLSKGYRQRIGIADAILAEPPVIIMDEPTIGLDPHQILAVRDLIAKLRGRMTVLISSHILPEIEVTCDRVLIINQGRVVAAGTPAALRCDWIGPGHYELEFAGPLEILPELLATLHPSLHLVPRSTPDPARRMDQTDFQSLRLVAAADAPDLCEPLVQLLTRDARFRLRTLGRSRHTLEDVFLAATQARAAA